MNPYLVAHYCLVAKREENVPLAPVGTARIHFSRLSHSLKVTNAKC